MGETPRKLLRTLAEEDRSLWKWESLNRLLGADRGKFTMIGRQAYEAMEDSNRQEYNERRIRFMAGGMTVTTGTILRLIDTFMKTEMMNDGALVGRRGVMISGPASSGKSTACLSLLQYYLALYESRNPGAIADGAVPVIYTSIPATRTVKATLQRIARFLALPVRKSDTETDLASMLQEVLHLLGTKLIVLDEVQMLNGVESTSRPAVNNLKDLTNYFQGTIVYSGLNLAASGLLLGEAGLQLKQRVFKVDTFDFGGKLTMTSQKAAEWTEIVDAFSRALPLYAMQQNALALDAEWLHQYTGGNIGTLKAVLLDAASMLIREGDPGLENITPALLRQSIRDYAAEDTRHGPTAPLQGASARKRLADAAI